MGNLIKAMHNPCMDATTLVGRSQRPIHASEREATPSPYRMGFFLPMKKGQPDKTSPDSFIGASKVISHAKEKQFA